MESFEGKKSREKQKGTALYWEQAATNQVRDGQDKNITSILENKAKSYNVEEDRDEKTRGITTK